MKHIFLSSILLIFLFACNKNNEVKPLPPVYDDTAESLYKILKNNTKDSVNLKIYTVYPIINHNDSCLFALGIKENALWTGLFDSSHKEIHTWHSKNQYDKKQSLDFGYGETIMININQMNISHLNYIDQNNFYLLFGAIGNDSLSKYIIYNLLFIDNGQEVFYRDAKYYKIETWNKDKVLAKNDDLSPGVYTVFKQNGEKMFDLSPDFISFWTQDYFINDKEVICFNTSDKKDLIARVNAITNKDLWKVHIFGDTIPIFDDTIPTRSTFSHTIDKSQDDDLIVSMNITNYNGTKIKRQFKININTGQYSTIGYNVEKIKLDKDSIALAPNETAKLIATVFPTNATNKNITWASSDTTIVSIKKGNSAFECEINSHREGQANITAKTIDGNKIATCKVSVAPVKVSEILFTPSTIESHQDGICKFDVKINPSNATNKNIKWSYTNISTSLTDPVSIDEYGNIKILAESGKVQITAESEDSNVTCQGYIEIKQPQELIKIDACPYLFEFSTSNVSIMKLNSSIFNPTSYEVKILAVHLVNESNISQEIYLNIGAIKKGEKIPTKFKAMSFLNLEYSQITSIVSKYAVIYQVQINGKVFNIGTYINTSKYDEF